MSLTMRLIAAFGVLLLLVAGITVYYFATTETIRRYHALVNQSTDQYADLLNFHGYVERQIREAKDYTINGRQIDLDEAQAAGAKAVRFLDEVTTATDVEFGLLEDDEVVREDEHGDYATIRTDYEQLAKHIDELVALKKSGETQRVQQRLQSTDYLDLGEGLVTLVQRALDDEREETREYVAMFDETIVRFQSVAIIGLAAVLLCVVLAVLMLTRSLKQIRDVAEREARYQQQIIAAHYGGMADTATGILHNVGNVQNSIGVATSVLLQTLQRSRVSDVKRLCSLINEHRDDLGTFLTEDVKGKQVLEYLDRLANALIDERDDLVSEVEKLSTQVEHVNSIISVQQSYASLSGLVEPVQLKQIVEDALNLKSSSFERHNIQIVRNYEMLPDVTVHRQKVLQILVNIVGNANDALRASDQPNRRITVVVGRRDKGYVEISITDNGAGIARDDLAKVFSFGFSTKSSGHGFGLHSSANAAAEMGGSLTCSSDGPGKGATFTLTLSVTPPAKDSSADQAREETVRELCDALR